MYRSFEYDDSPHEECGVFGVFAPGIDVARLTFFALYALQHRGQESAGIAVANNGEIFLRKRLGLVSQAFSESDLRHLKGQMAVGHTRYSTTGATRWTHPAQTGLQCGWQPHVERGCHDSGEGSGFFER